MHFWAKTTSEGNPGISVYDHMVNVGCVARAITEALPEIPQRFNLDPSLVAAFAALHDLGKISPGFQSKCEAWLIENRLVETARNSCWDTEMEPDHGKVSHAAIMPFLMERGLSRKTAKFISCVLGGHHGRLTPPNDRGYHSNKKILETSSGIDWQAERMSAAHRIWDYFAPHDPNSEIEESSPSLWWIAGLVSVADWIGSDERFFPPERFNLDADPYVVAIEALKKIGFFLPGLIQNLSFEDIFNFSPNDMQTKALATISGPGVYVIEAPMGMGKTEAALGAAYQLMKSGKASGMYFALPTQATSNRIHLRVNEFLQHIAPESPASRLIHGNSWLMDINASIFPVGTLSQYPPEQDARFGQTWFSSSKRSLIAHFGVGTVDQALLGVVAAKHFFVRHFALAGKVVIIDEVHSYDLYTGTLINNLITTLERLGCTVIILSATLTGKRREQITSCPTAGDNEEDIPYPLITGRKEKEPILPASATPPASKNFSVDFLNRDQACLEAITLAEKGGSVLWICNTVDDAQSQYQQIKEQATETFPIGLLHSRFPFWQRERLEVEWMERFGKTGNTRCGSILISTQVVEQSVDLDADLLITELAPTDMLLQRMGRLWRHERGKRPVTLPKICIIKEEKSLETFRKMTPQEIMQTLGRKAFVYAPYILLRSLEVWQAAYQKTITIPTNIRSLLKKTYDDLESEPDAWQKLFNDWFGTDSAKKMIADRNSNIWQLALEDREGVQTRLNEIPTVSLVLCREIIKHRIDFLDGSSVACGSGQQQLAFAQAIHKNLVKVPLHVFDGVTPLPVFSDSLYGDQTAGLLQEDGMVKAPGLKKGIKLFYSDELGLVIEKTY